MARTLSYPMRLAPNGSFVTVDQGTDTDAREQIAVICLTRPGERPVTPGFGTSDPAFTGFRGTELVAQIAQWGPPVAIDDIAVEALTDTVQHVTVEFHVP